MINETFTHFLNELTTNMVEAAYEPNSGLSAFQILLIAVGLISLITACTSAFFKQGVTGVFYIIGFVKWCYYKATGRDI